MRRKRKLKLIDEADYFEPEHGILALRYALCVTLIFNLISALLYFVGSRTISKDITDTETIMRQRAQQAAS